MNVFAEISIVIFLAATVSLIMRVLKQPLIVGYILTGIIAGPYVLNVIHDHEIMELFSKLGITILLFIVGLHMSPKVVKEVGKVSLLAGLGQIIFTSGVGFTIATILGIPKTAAMYIGIAVTFSSTIIILKLLSDKGDLTKLYGKIAIGLLLVQDVIATVILVVTAATGNAGDASITYLLITTLLKAAILVNVLLLFGGFILQPLIRFLAKSQELLFLFSIAWGMGLASLFQIMGFSVEIGALIAGVTLASTHYVHEISSRMRPLRDFFVVLFFIFLGSQMVFTNMGAIIMPALLLSFFVLVGNPIIVIILMNLLGYNKRTSFFAGMTITQMSEFSLILATLGFQIGHLSREILSLITLVGVITITFSTYLILNSHKLYPFFSRWLTLLEMKKTRKTSSGDNENFDSVLFGYNRVGHDFVKSFEKHNLNFVVVDFNPEVIKRLNEEGHPNRYGDVEDVEFLQELNLPKLKFVVSTIMDFPANEFLVQKIRSVNKKAIVIVISYNVHEAKELYKQGATYVIMPHYLGAHYASKMIADYGLDFDKFHAAKEKHMTYLEKRHM